MKSKPWFVLLVLFAFFSACKQPPIDEQTLKDEYSFLRDFNRSLVVVQSKTSKQKAYQYLDSVATATANTALAIYAEVKQVQYLEHTKDLLDQSIEKLIAIKESRAFRNASPYLKFHTCMHLSKLYEQKEDVEQTFDLNFEAVQYIEPYPDIYHYEIAFSYFNIDATAGRLFEEHEIGKKANQIATEVALKYKHRQIAFMSMYNANLRRVSNEEYDEAIKYANKTIELGGQDDQSKKFISLAYACLRECYLKQEKLDSVAIIDQKCQQLFEQDYLPQDLYVEYLLLNLDDNIAILEKDELLKQFDYIRHYYLNQNQGESNYHLHLLYANMARYWNRLNAPKQALQYANLSYGYFMAMSSQPNTYVVDQLAIFEEILTKLKEQKPNSVQQISVLSKIDSLQYIQYNQLQKKSNAYEQQLQLWAEKEKEVAEDKIVSQRSEIQLWGGLFALVSIASSILIYLMLKLKKQREQLDQVNEELLGQTKVIEEQNLHLEERNASLSNFAAIAAHDLKAPLRTISSFSRLLYKRYEDKIDEGDKGLFDFIINDSMALKDMIEGLLSYSSVSKVNLEMGAVDIGEVIQSVQNSLSHSIQESGASFYVQDNAPQVVGEQTLLKQLFLNLFNNALKFRKEEEAPLIQVEFKDNGADEVLISVADNGIGVDEKDHEEIFGIFKKLHSRAEYEGCGIGLSTCKKIVESHGGKITISSALGQGTTFNVSLKRGKVLGGDEGVRTGV